MNFVEFPKIPRLFRDIVITEKIDGTNAQVQIEQVPGVAPEDMHAFEKEHGVPLVYTYLGDMMMGIYAGSRNRYITPQSDNFGFAKWVMDNHVELVELGPGTHYGEWWGAGIQRTYGLKEKKFSLFNVHRWSDPTTRPACCDVVPVLYEGSFFPSDPVRIALNTLSVGGSVAAPGFMNPEGVVVFHKAGGYLFKATIDSDGVPKGKGK